MGIYKIKDSWYIDFYADGRRIRKRVGSKRDAENALNAVKADILRGEYNFKKDRRVRFEDFAKEYLEYSKINKRSWGRDESSLNRLLPFFKDMLLSKITPLHIEDYKKLRIKKVKGSTVNRELICLQHMFTIAEKFRKFEGKNPVKEVKYFQESQYIMRVLDKEEIKQLIDASSGYLKSIIILALNTGMRKGEILNLRWNDIDFIEDYIYIKQSKSNVTRKIPMNSVVRNTLKSIKRENDFIFHSSKTGTRFTDFFRSFKTACRKVGITDLRFHDLRHTAATLMVMGGIDLVTVSQILGHSTIQMTMKYAHPTPENKRHAVNVLASAFKPEKKEKVVINRSQEQIITHVNPLLSASKVQ